MIFKDYILKESIKTQKFQNQKYWIDSYGEITNFFLHDWGSRPSLKQYLHPYKQDKTFAVYDKRDPGPFRKMILGLPRKYIRHIL